MEQRGCVLLPWGRKPRKRLSLQPLGCSQIPSNRPGWRCPPCVGPGPCPPEAHSLLRDTTYSQWLPKRILIEVYLGRYTHLSQHPGCGQMLCSVGSQRELNEGLSAEMKVLISTGGTFASQRTLAMPVDIFGHILIPT